MAQPPAPFRDHYLMMAVDWDRAVEMKERRLCSGRVQHLKPNLGSPRVTMLNTPLEMATRGMVTTRTTAARRLREARRWACTHMSDLNLIFVLPLLAEGH
jgi:hypothetical protein